MPVEKKFVERKGVEIPEGTQVGLFAGLIHLGTQRNEYEGKVSYKDQVLLRFELPDVTLEDGRPITITKRETNSAGAKSNMLKLVRALKGTKDLEDGVDYEELIGQPVMLEIAHTAKGNAKIDGYMPVPEFLKKTVKPLMTEPQLLFDVEQISDKELEAMPEWLRELINKRVQEGGDIDEGANY